MRIALALMLTASLAFGAEPYPTKPVRIIVPFVAGGGGDQIARITAEQLGKSLDSPFIVDNRAGAGGTIGTALAAKSPPDGYLLMLVDTATVIAPNLYKSLPYDVARDFAPISLVVTSPLVVAVGPSVKVLSVQELVELAKSQPGKLTYGSAGVGSVLHLAGELFVKAANINVVHIPYKGAGDAVTALLGGHVDIVVGSIPNLLSHIKEGRLRALAVTSNGRSPALPEVPSLSEAGLGAAAVTSWMGIQGPAGMPKEIVAKLQASIAKFVGDPSVRDKLAAQGGTATSSSPEQFAAFIRDELQRWATASKAAGLVPE
jgi:tripartite-type tricarboxylate transporter receptor subunit TctC